MICQKELYRKSAKKENSTESNRVDFENNGVSGNGSSDYNNEDVGADAWDPSLYGDVDTNEALAAEIFDFTEKEFERVVSKYKQGIPSDMSLSTSTSTTNNSRSVSASSIDITAQAANKVTASYLQHLIIWKVPAPDPQHLILSKVLNPDPQHLIISKLLATDP